MRALRELALQSPSDVALIAFDNAPWSSITRFHDRRSAHPDIVRANVDERSECQRALACRNEAARGRTPPDFPKRAR